MENLDLQKELSFEEVKHFFSKCGEFEISKHDDKGTFKINLKVEKEVNYSSDVNVELIISNHNYSTLIYKPTIQKLIRAILKLGGN
jgi:hypothetical protein